MQKGEAKLIYVDQKGHMVSSGSLDELHAFARKIGLKREWFQDKRIPHYDLTTRAIQRAIAAGAMPVDSRTLVRKAKICKTNPGTDVYV